MIAAIDGACKRNGKPDCLAVGVAWIETEKGELLFKAYVEENSTNQRGEIFGLRETLEYANEQAENGEDIVIITDSQYLHDTVSLEWYDKWRNNYWCGSSGDTVKNVDLWKEISGLLDALQARQCTVVMQWTKGHLIHYTPAKIKYAMQEDPSGIELLTRIITMASRAPDKTRIVNDFNHNRQAHNKYVVPPETAFDWAVRNTVADCLATYLVKLYDTPSEMGIK